MPQVRISRRRLPRPRLRRPDDQPLHLDPRDPEVVRAKAIQRDRPAS